MHVLLIEDNVDHQELIRDAFFDAFAQTGKLHCESKLASGFSALENQAFDLCLCDLSLPDSSLTSTVEALKSLKIDIPVVVLTSLNDIDLARSLVQEGIQDYLPKDSLTSELLARVCHYAIERKQQQTILEQRNLDLQGFCYSLSHDFNGPIRRIGQLSELLYDGVGQRATLTDDEEFCFKGISSNVAAIKELIRGLYEYLSIDNNRIELAPIDLNTLLTDLRGLISASTEKDYQLSIESLPTISGQQSLISILFQNLILNSIKYCENPPEVKISTTTCESANNVTIKLTDNGIGMPADKLSGIFKPFYRLHSASEYTGTGLGLSIVSRIIEKHGGQIKVESEVGQGSTFYITLPLAAG